MSNGDDVLDNWEEIDEEGLNKNLEKVQAQRKNPQLSLMTAIDSAGASINNKDTLSSSSSSNAFRPMKLLQRTPTQESTSSNSPTSAAKSPLDDMSVSFQPVMMMLNKPADEYQEANYVNPLSNQTVKILRRPTQSMEARNSDVRPKQPIKTLQQREQEYAEARLRIMGSAKNPEDDSSANAEASATTPAAPPPTATTMTAAPTGNSYVANNNTNSNIATNTTNNGGNKATNRNAAKNHYGGGGGGNNQQQKAHNSVQQQQKPPNFYYQQQQQQPPQAQQGHPAFHNRTAQMPPAQHQQQQQLSLIPPPYAVFHNSSPHQQSPQNPKQHQSWSPVVGGSVSMPAAMRQQQQENVMRLPRGPDGSVGFQMRR